MADPFAPRPESDHLSQLAFDRLLADEDQGLARAREHLSACPECRRKLDLLETEQRAALQHLPERVERLRSALGNTESRRKDSTRRRWSRPRWLSPALGLGGVAAAATAAALIWLVLPRVHEQPPGADVVRVKGAPAALEVLRLDGNRAVAITPEETLQQGSRLAFRARCPAGCWVLLFALGERGVVEVLEGEQPQPWRLEPSAQPLVLPVQAEVDGHARQEHLVALFCREPLAPAVGRHSIARTHAAVGGRADGTSGAAAPPDLARELQAPLDGCAMERWVLHVHPAPDGR